MKPDVFRPGSGPTVCRSHLASCRTRLFPGFLLAFLLAVPAAPALAQQLPTSSLAADSADLPSGVAQPMLPEAMGMSDRALLLATDLNRLFAADPATSANGTTIEDSDGRIRTLLQKALTLLGTPYRWGGTSPERGFDCSGLVKYVFNKALGIDLPRVSRDQARNGEAIKDRKKMAAGDLVFFGRRGRVDHVGIYLGEGRFVHAPSRGKTVSVSRLDSGYWSNKFMQARRVEGI